MKQNPKRKRQDFVKMSEIFLHNSLSKLVQPRVSLHTEKPKGRRSSDKYKQFALSIYFLGPRAYNFFKQYILP